MDYDKTKVPDTYDSGRALKSSDHNLLSAYFAEKMVLRADGFVARLDDDEFQNGLRQIEADAQSSPSDEAVAVNVDMVLYRRD